MVTVSAAGSPTRLRKAMDIDVEYDPNHEHIHCDRNHYHYSLEPLEEVSHTLIFQLHCKGPRHHRFIGEYHDITNPAPVIGHDKVYLSTASTGG